MTDYLALGFWGSTEVIEDALVDSALSSAVSVVRSAYVGDYPSKP